MKTGCDPFLLWAAAGGAPAFESPARLPKRLGAQESVRLVEAAVREGLAGLLYRRLQEAGPLPLVAEAAARHLQSLYYLTVQSNLKTFALLTPLLEDFHREGIRVALLQGAALLIGHYRDPGLRPLSDVDLWVLPEQHGRLVGLLSGAGFENHPLTPGVWRSGGLLLDVHTHLLWPERIRASRFLFTGDERGIFQACRPLSSDGGRALTLAPIDQVVYLTVHALKHNLERLVWLADLAGLTRGWTAADWERLHRRASELGQARLAAVLGYLLRELFGRPVPGAPAAGTGLSAVGRHLLRRRRSGPLPKWSSLFLLSAGGLPQQLCFALESMFPRPGVLREVFGQGLNCRQLYCRRVAQLLGMIR
jgi:hypothetical protein